MNDWDRIQELFDAAAGLDPVRRDAVLAERTAGEPALRARVEALIDADAIVTPVLDAGAGALLAGAEEVAAGALCGARFGGYEVEAHLSSGGMGHVYRATRTAAGATRRVAVKVLRVGLGDGLLARFAAERATLASLEHEHIVAFLDAGALDDGRPYLVMELVEGAPLTAWAAAAPRRRRLALFVRVLAAVQYAHGRLVVHRDLKPGNILVTGNGVPKLCDFGIAAVLGQEDDSAPPLTPGYASPEQLQGGAVTAASDIYSLGRLLAALLAAGGAPAPGADLAAIIDKATAGDPAARYASADAFADDVRRHLDDRPVAARRGSRGHRLACALRRNRWSLVAAAAVLLAAVAGWVGADMSRRAAEHDASLGWGAHAQARMYSRVLDGIVADAADADSGLGARVVARLRAELEALSDCPETEALTRMVLAQLLLQRGELDAAESNVRRALHLCATTRGLGSGDRRRAEALQASIAAKRG